MQYDPPSETSDYVHRAGRVARAGGKGSAVLFLMPGEVGYVSVLKAMGMKGMGGVKLGDVFKGAADRCGAVVREGLKKAGGGSKDEGEVRV